MAGTPEDQPSGSDRRSNFELRERLDEIIAMARKLSQDGTTMSREELDSVRARIEWLAEEIWGAAVYGPLE
jgi:low affinity Fe/Cu permease